MATFTNQALLSYNGITTPSNIVTGEILGSLSVTKGPSRRPIPAAGASPTSSVS